MSLLKSDDITKLATAIGVSEDKIIEMMTDHVKATSAAKSSGGQTQIDGGSAQAQAGAMPMQFYLSQPARLPSFSGEVGRGETRYEVWKSEVEKLQDDNSNSVQDVDKLVRKSLQGKAARLAKRLGTEATLDELLKKLESRFGPLTEARQLMRDFYGAQQGETEDVASWACRLEDILDRAREAGRVQGKEMDGLLREQFWAGLRSELQEGNEYRFDKITDFDDLEESIREVEQQRKVKLGHGNTPDPSKKGGKMQGTAKMSQTQETKEDVSSMFKQMMEKFAGLQAEVAQIKQSVASQKASQPERQRTCYLCGEPDHLSYDCPKRHDKGNPAMRGAGGSRGTGRGTKPNLNC